MRYRFLQRHFLHRFDHEAFRRTLGAHVRRFGLAWLLLFVAAALFQGHFSFGLNATPSLPHHVFLIHKGKLPQRGQYVAFRWLGGGSYDTHGGNGFVDEFDVERKFRETRLFQVAPINSNLILAYVANHVLGMPKSY